VLELVIDRCDKEWAPAVESANGSTPGRPPPPPPPPQPNENPGYRKRSSAEGLDSYSDRGILGQEGSNRWTLRAWLQRAFCGIPVTEPSIASMLFLGPTGVGKTENAEL